MKKVLLTVSALLLSSCAYAGILEKLPPLNQGVAYDLNGDGISYLSTAELAKYKGFSLEAGYSTKDKAVAVVSYNIGGLSKLGIDLPILNFIDLNVGYYVGYGRIQLNDGFDNGNNELSHGPSATLLKIKF